MCDLCARFRTGGVYGPEGRAPHFARFAHLARLHFAWARSEKGNPEIPQQNHSRLIRDREEARQFEEDVHVLVLGTFAAAQAHWSGRLDEELPKIEAAIKHADGSMRCTWWMNIPGR